MTKRIPEKAERNKKLFDDYHNGVDMIDLINKYGITASRIYMLIKKQKNKLQTQG